MDHSVRMSQTNRREWEEQGYVVFSEEQNSFVLRGRSAKLAGKPDLIAKKEGDGVVVDIKGLAVHFRLTVFR